MRSWDQNDVLGNLARGLQFPEGALERVVMAKANSSTPVTLCCGLTSSNVMSVLPERSKAIHEGVE